MMNLQVCVVCVCVQHGHNTRQRAPRVQANTREAEPQHPRDGNHRGPNECPRRVLRVAAESSLLLCCAQCLRPMQALVTADRCRTAVVSPRVTHRSSASAGPPLRQVARGCLTESPQHPQLPPGTHLGCAGSRAGWVSATGGDGTAGVAQQLTCPAALGLLICSCTPGHDPLQGHTLGLPAPLQRPRRAHQQHPLAHPPQALPCWSPAPHRPHWLPCQSHFLTGRQERIANAPRTLCSPPPPPCCCDAKRYTLHIMLLRHSGCLPERLIGRTGENSSKQQQMETLRQQFCSRSCRLSGGAGSFLK